MAGIRFDLEKDNFSREANRVYDRVSEVSTEKDATARNMAVMLLKDFDKSIVEYSERLIMYYECCKEELLCYETKLDLVEGKRRKRAAIRKSINKMIENFTSRQEKMRKDINHIKNSVINAN